jgi:HAD superfamily hydrolase (TIGR01509 family)
MLVFFHSVGARAFQMTWRVVSWQARIDAMFRELEQEAVRGAEPTPHAHEAIRACHKSGRRLAVVSNNAQEAVEAYLAIHGLTDWVDAVAGRPFAKPDRMKPDTYLVRQAIRALGARAATCLMIGDSTADMLSAQAAGIRRIGYANKPGKSERLAEADAIITSMAEVEDALLATSPTL